MLIHNGQRGAPRCVIYTTRYTIDRTVICKRGFRQVARER